MVLIARSMGDDEDIAGALANWRAWVADGRASVKNSVLCINSPPITAEEWVERYVTEDRSLAQLDPAARSDHGLAGEAVHLTGEALGCARLIEGG